MDEQEAKIAYEVGMGILEREHTAQVKRTLRAHQLFYVLLSISVLWNMVTTVVGIAERDWWGKALPSAVFVFLGGWGLAWNKRRHDAVLRYERERPRWP